MPLPNSPKTTTADFSRFHVTITAGSVRIFHGGAKANSVLQCFATSLRGGGTSTRFLLCAAQLRARDERRLLVGMHAQQQSERGFSRAIGLSHGLKESFRALNRTGSASAIDLPSP